MFAMMEGLVKYVDSVSVMVEGLVRNKSIGTTSTSI